MPTTVQCPKCRQSYRVQDHLLGKAVQCKCGARMRIPPKATPGDGNGSLTDWMDQELAHIEASNKQAARQAALEAAEEAEKQKQMTRNVANKTPSQKQGKTLKQAIIRAIISTVMVLILTGVGAGVGIWYISTHPVAGASKAVRAERLGQGLGTIMGLGIGLAWLLVAFRYAKLKGKK